MAKERNDDAHASFVYDTANACAMVIREIITKAAKEHVKKYGKLSYAEFLMILIEISGQVLEDIAESTDTTLDLQSNYYKQGLDMWVEHANRKNKNKED